jgi:general transcription factor 3C protein 4
VSGLVFVPQKDIIIISLFDGTLHVVHDVSTDPSWSSEDSSMTGAHISVVASSVFSEVDRAAIQRSALIRITGLAPYDDNGILMWVHE